MGGVGNEYFWRGGNWRIEHEEVVTCMDVESVREIANIKFLHPPNCQPYQQNKTTLKILF